MPWRISKRGGRYCVVKEGERKAVPGGCHKTRAEAVKHQRALYASEEASSQGGVTMRMTETGTGGFVSYGGTTVTPVLPDPSAMFSTVVGEASQEKTRTWEGVLAVEGIVTSDGRYLMPGKIDHRELPLTLMAQTVTDEGHKGAFAAGKITAIRKEKRPDLGENAVAIIGGGEFANTEEGQLAADLLEDDVLRHVSIDFAHDVVHILDKETLEVVPEEELDLAMMFSGGYVQGFEGKIMGATLCAFSAFEDATMEIVDAPGRAIVASSFTMRKSLTASAAGIAPLAPPFEWFFKEEPDHPVPLTVTSEGQVFGHLALWNQCHRSLQTSCTLAPRSRSGYAFFHTGALTTEDGRKVNVGRITVGDGGHAPTTPWLGTQGAIDHYDKTGTVGAFVRATDGKHGIWLSGAVRSDCPAERVRDMEANPPSGDWREEDYSLELCAALSVPVAGFPVPRYEASLVAAGNEERVVALVAAGFTERVPFTRAEQRKLAALLHRAQELVRPFPETDWRDGFAVSAEERRRAAARGQALPDGSYPIRNCSDAANAIQAQGRAASPAKRMKVKAHIRKRVKALGCKGTMFDSYR